MTHEEWILKAKDAKSAEELLKLAKKSGIEMDAEKSRMGSFRFGR